jgi:CRISPR/Cas system Type II protein with McrA/HNH and RuvC-like nuclease domain
MKDVMKKQRQARRKIIRQWTALPRDKRQSMEQIAAYAKTAAQQNENAFVHSHRDPYEKIMGWLLPRADM